MGHREPRWTTDMDAHDPDFPRNDAIEPERDPWPDGSEPTDAPDFAVNSDRPFDEAGEIDVQELWRRVRVLEMENELLRSIASFHAGQSVDPSRSAIEVMTAQRRAPFAHNPHVGVRGTQTQHRILRAALEVFAATDYRSCRVEQISDAAGCSRSAFYQYFSSREDLFRKLAGQVARSLYVVTESLPQITADERGRLAIREWLAQFGEIYDEFAPVFTVFATAAEIDQQVETGAGRVATRHAAALAQRFTTTSRGVRDPVPLARMLFQTVVRAHQYRRHFDDLDSANPMTRERLAESLSDVLHRIVFGPLPGINIRADGPHQMAHLLVAESEPDSVTREPQRFGPAGQRTRSRLLEAGHRVFIEKGYHDARVDDIVEAAETSHGTFYRYFDNRQALFRTLAFRSGQSLISALDAFPDLTASCDIEQSGAALADWIIDHAEVYRVAEPIAWMFLEAIEMDPLVRSAALKAMEDARHRLALGIEPRGFADVDADALVLLSMLGLVTWPNRYSSADEATHMATITAMIQRGLLGADVSV
jgi:AcrR family transcriptional regulator